MAKITIMQGLPASGKSTKAKEILDNSGYTVRINKDLLRTMLHFDKWSGLNERMTQRASEAIARRFLEDGLNVIIDDTNLNESTVQGYKKIANDVGAKIEYVQLDTGIKECIKRDLTREKQVGSHVIIGMALQNGLYPNIDEEVVLCDIDGTLADIDHRLHYVQGEKKDWKGFFSAMSKDISRLEVIDVLKNHVIEGKHVFIVSARPNNYRKETEEWLGKALGGLQYVALFMRPENDSREDSIVKKEMYDKYFKNLKVVEVIDDRPRVIRMWRELGLNVRDVGSGVEF